jgi:hypothetical protein
VVLNDLEKLFKITVLYMRGDKENIKGGKVSIPYSNW